MPAPSGPLRPTIACFLALFAWAAPASAAEIPAAETTLPVGLRFELPADSNPPITLRGPDDAWQIALTHAAGAMLRDVTLDAAYSASPEGIVAVDSKGRVTPLAEGQAQVAARLEDLEATFQIRVENFARQPAIHFANQIVPIFTRLGCNAGGCHGKSGGQNGFRLSLLGFEPADDYEFLTREDRGRRLFPAAPERSLLLQKATASAPHGGGAKLDPASAEYRLLRRWISQGMPQGSAEEPGVVGLSILPESRRLAPESEQQLVVVARYADGRVEDVTRLAQLDAADPAMVELMPEGRIKTRRQPGEAAVMARFQGQVALFRATVPLGPPLESPPVPVNVIDEHVFAKLQSLGLPPSAPCDDATFLRRVTLDVCGRLPTAQEGRAFLENPAPDKRQQWVETLLASSEYADWFANKWSAVLRNKRRSPENQRGTLAFHRWIAESLYENVPYDQFVRRIVTASGEVATDPPVVWYREVKDSTQRVEDLSQLFLGVRIQCARCHHHPFERWSQADYHRLAAFFSRVSKKPSRPGEDVYYHSPGAALATHPRTGERLLPAGLGAAPLELADDDDPRAALADWMADPENPFFAKALVNRYWKHFFGRGIVEPEDDLRATNPATNDALLGALSQQFIASGYDLKQLVRTICASQSYQLGSEPNSQNSSDQQAFSRHYPQRLPAEALLDAIDQVTSSRSDFAGLPLGTRAVALPDQAADSYFLTVFGKPQADTACECERTQEANLAQCLHLLNSPEVMAKLTADSGRAAQLAADAARSNEEKAAELYYLALSRPPQPEESASIIAHLASRPEQPRQAWEDVIWALINTKEFLFNH